MRMPVRSLFASLALLVLLLALMNTTWESDVHAWRHEGRCLDCHAKNSDIEVKNGWTITPPASHNEQFRHYTHGRGGDFNYQRCASCHQQKECSACHAQPPESHTTDFIEPRGTGMERHILLGSVRPATCLTCHEPFTRQCVGCHTPAEVQPWQERAQREAGDRGWSQ